MHEKSEKYLNIHNVVLPYLFQTLYVFQIMEGNFL